MMPARKRPCMISADPTFRCTMAAAASATGSSGLVTTTRVVIRSLTVSARRGSSATFAYLVELRVRARRGRAGQFLRQQVPERTGPRGKPRPLHPEHLQRRLVELHVRTFGGDRVGEVIELVDEF